MASLDLWLNGTRAGETFVGWYHAECRRIANIFLECQARRGVWVLFYFFKPLDQRNDYRCPEVS